LNTLGDFHCQCLTGHRQTRGCRLILPVGKEPAGTNDYYPGWFDFHFIKAKQLFNESIIGDYELKC
jgi:hypothetical protein